MNKMRTALLVGVIALSVWGQNAIAFYNPSTGRWLSRDPIGEKGFELQSKKLAITYSEDKNEYLFVINNPITYVDELGLRYGNPPTGPNGPVKPPLPPVNCLGYRNILNTTCTDCIGRTYKDNYPRKAFAVCQGFARQFTGDPQQAAAACVAACLIKSEASIQKTWKNCDRRNCSRLSAHINCYYNCGFAPNFLNLPPGADVVGWQDLLPSCIRANLIIAL